MQTAMLVDESEEKLYYLVFEFERVTQGKDLKLFPKKLLNIFIIEKQR